MKRILLTFAMALMASVPMMAQEEAAGNEGNVPYQGKDSFVNGIVAKEHIVNKKYIPYAFVREADVLWSKTIWRMIDLREKINLPLYYPTSATTDDRRSLMQVIWDGLNTGMIRAYTTNANDEFDVIMHEDAFKRKLGAGRDTVEQEDPETDEIRQAIVENGAKTDEVKKFLLKEVWYFDKKHSRMDVRIIGICPIREYMNTEGTRYNQELCFWIPFETLRPLLAVQEVYNTKNDSYRESFDDVFAKRRFGSYIFKETNVYNNRFINDYTASMESTMEAERIRQELFLKEHDMWEY